MLANLSQRARGVLLFFLVLTPIVGVFGFQGIQSFTIYNRFANGNSESATGIIVDNTDRVAGGRNVGDIYYPTIQYVTKTGDTVNARDDMGIKYVAQGQSVNILYRREDMTHVILADSLDGQKFGYELALGIVVVFPLILFPLFLIFNMFSTKRLPSIPKRF